MWLIAVKECVLSLLWLLCALTHSLCTSSRAHHGSVTALRGWWGDRKDFWLLCVAWAFRVCLCVSSLTKSQWTQRVLVESALSEYQIARYICPWLPLGDLSWTQQTLRQTDFIWKSTLWIRATSVLQHQRKLSSVQNEHWAHVQILLDLLSVFSADGKTLFLSKEEKFTGGFKEVLGFLFIQQAALRCKRSTAQQSHKLGSSVVFSPSRDSRRGNTRQIKLVF